ncbi:MAG: S8 family peptidase [Bacteroidales bacterium]|jgi:subtilisin family serine protease
MKTNLLKLSLLFGAILIINSCDKSEVTTINQDLINLDENQPSFKSSQQGPEFESNELIIKFKDGTGEVAQSAALSKINGKVKEKIHTAAMMKNGDNQGILLISVPAQALDAISKAKGLPEVEYAEPNFIYQHFATANDTYYNNGSLWGMYSSVTTPANQYGSQAAAAWSAGHTGSNTVYVGIIDEGYMYMHEDLAANAGTNPNEIPGNGIDDDGNGYKDDVYGWDFDGNNNSVFDGVNDDHGTHVAGTIGAVGNNLKGVAGICWNVKLLDAKFLGNRGGTTANAIKAVDYFTALKSAGVNIVATNNSWGGGGYSQALQDAIERANTAGILFIAAAGNDGLNTETSVSYPSGYPNANIIAVASITSTGALSSFSNYAATKVDLGAPGSSIISCVPVKSGRNIVSGYASYNGTSMATPHVTGSVALYASTHPGSSAATIKAAILGNATPTASLAGKCVTGGRLNVSGF